MDDFGSHVNCIVIKNLPKDYTESQLEKLFSKFGRIVSSRILSINSNSEGGCGFINYTEPESCTNAVENMNNYVIDQLTLYVNHSSTQTTNISSLPQNECRFNDESNIENNSTSLPNSQNRFSSFRVAGTHSSTTLSELYTNTSINTNESQSFMNSNQLLWNSTNIEQQHNKIPFQNKIKINIREHDSFITNKNYSVYLSNLELPNIIFAATLDDYINTTLLLTKMNNHEQLAKVQAKFYQSNILIVGQFCAALFNGDWYRARILKIDENRVQVQYIDWGNIGWCDSILDIRPLLNEYYKDPVLFFDVKLEMIVLRIENGLPHVQLNLGERNLNAEIRAILPQPSVSTTTTVNKSY
ncbi:unnamed protein product [Rotaria magnacalcarata]|uniref:Uncharacterized protein n=3 Tax=Rotaria magnacalcarata TaxID=392030 RepID=A0A8S2PCB0_9BILA|nr:unnamed protein product [Rotaria magnacalcarata]